MLSWINMNVKRSTVLEVFLSLAAVALVSCGPSGQTSAEKTAAPAAGGGTAPGTVLAAAPPAAAASGARKESIRDPGFNMTAYDVNVPANWKYEGTYVPGTSCLQTPFPVVRAYSPDGLTEWRRYPRLDWTWTNLANPAGNAPSHPDCLNLKQEISGQEFLKYFMGVLQIAYVRDSPFPQAAIDQKQKFLDQLNASAASNSRILKLEPPGPDSQLCRRLRRVPQRELHHRSKPDGPGRLHSLAAPGVQPEGRVRRNLQRHGTRGARPEGATGRCAGAL